jgi:predicted permease
VLRAQSIPINWQPESVYVASFDLASAGYDGTRTSEFLWELRHQVGAMPGVESVAVTRAIPFASSSQTLVKVDGNREVEAKYNTVSADYFKTLRIPIVRGRPFTSEEIEAKLPYAVVSQSMANRLWPGSDPIGQHFNSKYEVIGVASDISSTSLGKLDGPFFYAPVFADAQQGHSLLLRTKYSQQELSRSLNSLVRSFDRNVVIHVGSLEENLTHKLQPARFAAILSVATGMLALAMATLGLYGLVAFLVSQRIREIGIRMALGARARDVYGLILQQGMKLVLVGTGLGIAISFLITRLLAAFIFGVSNTDVITFITVPLALAVTALIACSLPARRAARVNPSVALRRD